MNKTLAAVLALVCAGALFAQAPADKTKPAPAPAPKAAPAAAPKAVPAAAPQEPAKKTAAPAKSDEPEESVVMIDSKAEPEDRQANEEEQPQGPAGIPSSFGQCKGVMNEGGRNLLVFESIEDGTISLVQISVGKANVTWNVLARIPRSND